MIISEDAFEVHSGLGISNGSLQQVVQRGVEQPCYSFQQFCYHRKQALDECELEQSVPDVAEEISKGFVIGEPLSQGYDGVGYEGKRGICDLRIQIQALASAKFQMLFGFVEQNLDIPADLVKFNNL